MAYRINRSYDEVSSDDDDGPSTRKERRLNDDEPMTEHRAGSKAAQMWTDLLAEQNLSETFSGAVGVHQGECDKVERGVESYILPDIRPFAEEHELRSEKRETPASDSDPFDFVADEEEIENASDEFELRSQNYGDRSRNCEKLAGSFIHEGRKANGKHSASTSRSKSSSNGTRNSYGSNRRKCDRIMNKFNNGDKNLKRKRNGRQSNATPSSTYSLETLMATEFPQDIEIDELARRIADALGENDGTYVMKVVMEVGEEKAFDLFEATRQVEASGGMMTIDGSRRRTPGGVFMTLFKKDPNISPDSKERIFNLQKATGKELRKIRRRIKRDITTNASKKDLPKATEVLLFARQQRKRNLFDVPMNEN